MDTLDRYAAELTELDGLEALPDDQWAQAARVAAGRPDVPLATVARRVAALEAFLGNSAALRRTIG